ncbi:MAG: hypothetical protein GY807_24100 [Gammaproteobacteria bacterium]|nr:hypothetical protein [Gammaproteobacteria bacterium]
MTDIRKKLKDIVAGLEGVTPKPWDIDRDTTSYGPHILHGTPAKQWPIATIFREDDVEHFQRCDPDTMREINQVVEKLDKENEHLVYGMHQTDLEIEEKLFQLQEMSKALDSRDAQIACLKLEFAAKDTEIEQLRKALEPFAKAYHAWEQNPKMAQVRREHYARMPGQWPLALEIKVQDGRMARAALAHKED